MITCTIERRIAPQWPNAPFGYVPYMGQKHVKLVADSIRGDVLAAFGDYAGQNAQGQGTDNSHSEIFSYKVPGDVWDTEIDRKKADTTAGWPRGVCRAGACFDARRGVMWKTGGDERLSSYPPNLVSGGLWAFRRDKTWHKVGPSHTGGSTYNLAHCDASNSLYVVASGALLKYDLTGVVIGDGIERNNWSVIPSPVSDGYIYNDHQFPVDRNRNRIVFYAPVKQETWAYYTVTREFRKLNSQPLPVECYAQLLWIKSIDRVVLFSGLTEEAYQTGNIVNHQIFALDPQTEQWGVVPATGPDFLDPAAFYFGLGSTYDEVNNCVVVIADSRGKTNYIAGSENVSIIRFSQSEPVPPVTLPEPPQMIDDPYFTINGVQYQISEVVTQPPAPVDCVLSAWSTWSAWSPCVGGQQSRTRTRTVVTPPSDGGAACGPLTETETQTCTEPPPSGGASIPGTTLSLIVAPPPAQFPHGHPVAITSAWNGAARDNQGKRMFLPVCGGHADYYPNASYVIQLPSGPSTRIHDMTPWGPPPQDANGYYVPTSFYPDGKPCSRHISQGAAWLPIQQRVMVASGSVFGSAGTIDRYVGWLDPVTGLWEHKQNIPFGNGNNAYVMGMWLLPDPTNQDKFLMILSGGIYVYTASTDSYAAYPSVGSDPLQGFGPNTTYAIDPSGDWLYAIHPGSLHPGSPGSPVWGGSYGAQYLNCVARKRLHQTTPQSWQAVPLTGDFAAVFASRNPGIEADPERNAFVVWAQDDPSAVTLINLSTHVCTRIALGFTAHNAHTMNGVYHRLMRYDPHSYALMTTPTLPVYLFTLP